MSTSNHCRHGHDKAAQCGHCEADFQKRKGTPTRKPKAFPLNYSRDHKREYLSTIQ